MHAPVSLLKFLYMIILKFERRTDWQVNSNNCQIFNWSHSLIGRPSSNQTSKPVIHSNKLSFLLGERKSNIKTSSCSLYYGNTLNAVYESLRHCATSRKAAGFWIDEVNEPLSIYLILPATWGPGVYSASVRNEYQKQKKNVSGEKSAADA
jgi:hypothetical protein